MKYAKYILFVVTLVLASCTINEDVNNGKDNSGKFRLMSRVVPFEGYNVYTRAVGDGPTENDIVSLDYVILAHDGKGNTSDDYRCIYYKHYGEGNVNEIITIDVETDFEEIVSIQGSEILKNCYVAVLANYPALYEKIEDDAENDETVNSVEDYIANKIVYKGENRGNYEDRDYFTSIAQTVEAVSGVPSTGLPRLGNYKDPTTGLGIIDLTAMESGKTYEVRLESLYAKMVFDITVKPTQEIIGVNGNTFSLSRYTIDNLATTVDMLGGTESAEGENSGTSDIVTTHTNTILGNTSSIITSSDRNVQFTCYLPERYTRAKVAANEYAYPFASDGANDVRPEDEGLLQRYKPMIARDDATYVTFSGVFVNHQGHSYDVSYKIYVGNDNYSNFDVVRNRQYNNIITIKGIENSSDQSTVNGAVSIDHRVDVQRTLPIIVSLRRETLLDAHFEVRPMRIRANTNHTGSSSYGTPAVKVEVVYNEGDPARTTASSRWIGLERSYGNGVTPTGTSTTYCDGTNNSAHGKRKYFTTNLTYSTLSDNNINNLRGTNGFSEKGGQVVIVPVHNDNVNNDGMLGECVWIYVDECLEASTDLNAIRTAKIHVTNGYLYNTKKVQDGEAPEIRGLNNNDFVEVEEPIVYTINQHKLFEITYNGHTYYIEHEEEYLYNFDANDTYTQNQTEFEGMEWGLNGIQLSEKYDAMYVSDIPAGDFQKFINAIAQLLRYPSIDSLARSEVRTKFNPKYDFYIFRDLENNNLPQDGRITYRNFKGFQYNEEITNKLLTNYSTKTEAKLNGLALDENPKSAIAYCYNRNKRDEDGDVVSLDWYLPSIDEIEEIMYGGHLYFSDFHGNLYWSCQPAYDKKEVLFECWQEKLLGGSERKGNFDAIFFQDDIDRARATKAVYKNGVFENVISSDADILESYDGTLTVNRWGTDMNFAFESNPNPNPNFDNTFKNYPGNQPRLGKKCRVRAVRKMTTTTN